MSIIYIPPDDSALKAISMWRQSEEATADRLLKERQWLANEALLRDDVAKYTRITGITPQVYNPEYDEAKKGLQSAQQQQTQLEKIRPSTKSNEEITAEQYGKTMFEEIMKGIDKNVQKTPDANLYQQRVEDYLGMNGRPQSKQMDKIESDVGTKVSTKLAPDAIKAQSELISQYAKEREKIDSAYEAASERMGNTPQFFRGGYGYDAVQLNDWYKRSIQEAGGDPSRTAFINQQMVQAMINNKTVHKRPNFGKFDYMGLIGPQGTGGKAAPTATWGIRIGKEGDVLYFQADKNATTEMLRSEFYKKFPRLKGLTPSEEKFIKYNDESLLLNQNNLKTPTTDDAIDRLKNIGNFKLKAEWLKNNNLIGIMDDNGSIINVVSNDYTQNNTIPVQFATSSKYDPKSSAYASGNKRVLEQNKKMIFAKYGYNY